MTKNRNKKKRSSSSMEITMESVSDVPQAMDTSEAGAQNPVFNSTNMKVKKGRPMKRSKNERKKKSIAKAVAKNEQSATKLLKNESKNLRTQSAKLLYE